MPNRLDRTAFKAHTMAAASKHAHYYRKLSLKERLHTAGYLNSIAFGFDEDKPPRMNKSVFKAGSLHNG